MIIDAKHLYKEETGKMPESTDYTVFRSKGQWVIETNDRYLLREIGLNSFIEIPDIDYLEWLENKVMELINSK